MAEEIRMKYHSIQDIVFTTLRDEIVSHALKPGDILNTVELSKRLGVSRTPIREALNRLISSAGRGSATEALRYKAFRRQLESIIKAAFSGWRRVCRQRISDSDNGCIRYSDQWNIRHRPIEGAARQNRNSRIIIARPNSPLDDS